MEKIITRTPSGSNYNRQPSELEPYRELMLRALVSSLNQLNELLKTGSRYAFTLPLPDNNYTFFKSWAAGGWLPLDCNGRQFLRHNGISGRDLERAVNDGVRAGLIARKTSKGYACIKLASKVV